MNGINTLVLHLVYGLVSTHSYKFLVLCLLGHAVGYGATTFPGLTEALTIEKNMTLVQYEASRLTDLLRRLSVDLLS